MTELTMPRLSDSMEEGTILTWLKRDGEHVEAGEDLVEIETDKATMTHPAEGSGVLHILAAEGDSLPVGAPIARLAAPGELAAEEPASDVPATQPPSTSEDPAIATSGVVLSGLAAAPVGANNNKAGAAVKATPVARRAAAVHGVPLDDVVGSGPLGRVTRADVLAKAGIPADPPTPGAPPPSRSPAADKSPASTAPATAKGDVEVVELSRMQAVVGRRMAEAKATVPHFQVQTEVSVDALRAFRAQLKDADEVVPSLNDLIVKAAALALRAHPLANGSYRDGRFELYSRVNVGIAVAAQQALVVPTIFDADQKSLGAIASESRGLAERVRAGTVTPPELGGATFTVSNLGMYGMTAITPVVNAPQAAILGVGASRTVLARDDGGAVTDRQLMTLTLSCDHRILYGAEAAELLSTIRKLLEKPLRLAL
jgi:pyruvate dehydrogenase E2 component (dihydrolipoamide acetyltransferase)